MINQEMYGLGANSSCIRELFEYGRMRAGIVGAENVFDYSLGNPSIPAPPQVNQAIKSSALTSVGPSIVVLSGMLSLLVTVGGPMGWMRLSFIGSVMFESIAAGIGTGSVGVQLGVDELTPLALTMAVWTMILGSVGWIIFSTFAADKMDKIQAKLAGSNPAGLTIISSGAIIGVFAAMCGQKLVMVDKTALATVLGGVCMFAMMTLTKNEKFAKLREWNLTIAMLVAVVLTAII